MDSKRTVFVSRWCESAYNCLFSQRHRSQFSGLVRILRCFLAPLWCYSPTRARAASYLRLLDHRQWYSIGGSIPLDAWSASGRDPYMITHSTHKRQISSAPSGIRIRNPDKRSAADSRLRLLGHWNRLFHGVNWYSCLGISSAYAEHKHKSVLVIISNVKFFCVHSFYSPSLSCGLVAKTPVKM